MSGWISSKLKVAETLLQQIDQQAAESLRKNEASRSDDDMSHPIPKKPSDHLPPLKDQLLKKKKTPQEKSEFVSKLQLDSNLKVTGNVNVNVNPKSSLTDGDWTELLNEPNKITNGSNRVPGLLKDGKRQVRSGSNLLALEKKKQGPPKTVRKSDVVLRDKTSFEVQVGGEKSSSEIVGKDASGKNKKLGVSNLDDENASEAESLINRIPEFSIERKNEQNRGDNNKVGGIPVISSSSSKMESLSEASDGESNMDSDSDSTSDSESETEKEERRKRREKILAEKAAAKAIEAIKDRENLVAKLEGEKQSLEKIIDERAKQQAQEASQLQMTMMETMDAVDLEKQKHNNTRMEALMKLAKLETTNAELAKSLATAQWNLQVEVNRVAELHRQIESKEANLEELTSKKKSQSSGNKLTALRGVELEHEILEAEHTFVTDKIVQLQDKAKTLETSINVTRKEIENPTQVEVELKRRLAQLTDHLIQKQSQVEALSSEKAMLMFRIEAVLRSLEENKPSLINNDLESGTWDSKLSNSRVVFQERLRTGQKQIGSIVSQLDSIFLTGATFIRRNPMAKIWSLVYLVCLHFWVLYIFRSQTDVSSDIGVISLENINNTGV